MNGRDQLNKEFLRTVCHFNLKQFQANVLRECNISWNKILRVIKQNKLQASVKVAAQFLLKRTNKWDSAHLRVKLYSLKLLDIVVNSRRRTWRGYKCLGVPQEVTLSTEIIKTKLKFLYQRLHIDTVINVIMRHDIHWIMVIVTKKDKKKRLVHKPPVFFAHVIGEPYILVSGRLELQELLDIVNALGYTGTRLSNLDGSDVNSLFRLMRNRDNQAVDSKSVFQHPPEYNPPDFTPSLHGLDFSQNVARKEHAEACFGEDPPKLENFLIKAPNATWNGVTVGQGVKGQPFSASVKLSSKNVPEMIKSMMEMGIYTPPFPQYVENLMLLGKNKVNLKQATQS